MKYIAKYNRFVDETGRVFCEQNNFVLNYSTEYSWYRTHNHKCRWEV